MPTPDRPSLIHGTSGLFYASRANRMVIPNPYSRWMYAKRIVNDTVSVRRFDLIKAESWIFAAFHHERLHEG